MKTILFAFAFLVSLAVSAQVTPPKKTFYVQPNATLSLTHYDPVVEVDIKDGKNLVFYYEWQSAKNPQIADADRTDKLYFEVPATEAKSIRATGEALKKYGTIRCRLCFCLEGGCRPTVKGELSVTRINKKKYAVKFKDDPESEDYLVNETFVLKKGK